jgi:2-oxoisovalerate dehydrogenase E1 component alpha subunit
MLIIVTNNGWGISTAGHEQHGEKNVSDRGKAFGMKTMVIDGNDVEVAYRGLAEAIAYVRNERKPLVLEAYVSRLYGHSSSSGSNFVENEVDCVADLETKLASRGLRTEAECKALRERIEKRLLDASRMVAAEPEPEAEQIWEHVFADEDHVGKDAIKAPHDNKKWRLPACTFPTAKPATKKGGN